MDEKCVANRSSAKGEEKSDGERRESKREEETGPPREIGQPVTVISKKGREEQRLPGSPKPILAAARLQVDDLLVLQYKQIRPCPHVSLQPSPSDPLLFFFLVPSPWLPL